MHRKFRRKNEGRRHSRVRIILVGVRSSMSIATVPLSTQSDGKRYTVCTPFCRVNRFVSTLYWPMKYRCSLTTIGFPGA